MIANTIITNNDDGWVNGAPCDRMTLANMAIAHNTVTGVTLNETSPTVLFTNKFTGVLKIGNNGINCNIIQGSGPDLGLSTICSPNGDSDATITRNSAVNYSSSFYRAD